MILLLCLSKIKYEEATAYPYPFDNQHYKCL